MATNIYRGASSEAFAGMTTKGFEFSRDLAKGEGMDLGMVVLGDPANNPAAAVLLHLPPGCRLPRHSHNCHRMEVVVQGSVTLPDGSELFPGDVAVSGPNEVYGPFIAGSQGCLTVEIFGDMGGLMPQPADGEMDAARTAHIAEVTAKHTADMVDSTN